MQTISITILPEDDGKKVKTVLKYRLGFSSHAIGGLTRTETGFSGRWILADRGARLGTGGQRDRLLLDLAAFMGEGQRIQSLTQTWLVAGTAGRQTELEPVWRVETAESVRYMSLRTGRELAE
jgi:hypothetical protein